MKKLLLSFSILVLSTVSSFSQASKWSADVKHSNAKFSVTHLVISEVEGSFQKFTVEANSPNADFTDASFTFNADVNSVTTGDDDRDKHLKSDDFFGAEKFPTISFTSTSFKKANDNQYVLEGNLTMKGITKKVKMDVIYNGTKNDPWGNTRAGFKIRGKLNRQDFGLNWKKTTDAGDMVVSDMVTIAFNIELVKAK